jgi:4-aminobutyrate aminotransferase
MDWPRGSHGNTFGGNPLSCAAALATIELIENEYLENAVIVGAYMQDALHEIMARHSSIGDVRGIGLMIGAEFVKDRQTKEPAEMLSNRIVEMAFERGLILLSCGKSVIRFAPPLSITKSEVDEGLNIFEEALSLGENEVR